MWKGLPVNLKDTEQLFVCFGEYHKPASLSKDWLGHCLKDVITQAYSHASQDTHSSIKSHFICAMDTFVVVVS